MTIAVDLGRKATKQTNKNLVDLYQERSNYAPVGKNGLATGVTKGSILKLWECKGDTHGYTS